MRNSRYLYFKVPLMAFLLLGMMVIEANAQPDTLWTKTFGGSQYDVGHGVQQTSDGGYIIAGSTRSYGAGNYDIYLIKTDTSGIEQWSQTFGGSLNDEGRSVQQTTDGGYIIAGYTVSYGAGSSDIYLIKTDALGDTLWAQTYGGSNSDWGYSVQQTSDGGYIIAGSTWSYGPGYVAVYLIKTDASGTEQWSQTFGGSSYDYGYSVQQTSDGGYIITGWTMSYGAGDYDVYLIKTNGNGNEEWHQTFGESVDDRGFCVQQTSDGGYVITGTTMHYPNWYDVFLIKTDGNGNERWTRTFGGLGWEWGFSVQQTSDGGYIIVGKTDGAYSDDVYLIKTDGNGNEVWTQTFGGSYFEYGYSVQQTSDGGYILTGETSSFGAGESDVWLIRLDNITGINPQNAQKPQEFTLYSAYPNPFNPSTVISFQLPVASHVKLEVFDITGRPVNVSGSGTTPTTEYFTSGKHEVTFDATDLSSGIYIYRLEVGEYVASGKMVLMK